MDFRVVWLSGVVVGSAALGSSSCSAPDPGEITFSERPRTDFSGASSGQASSGSTSGGTDGGGSSSGDGGGEGGAADPVFVNEAFAPGTPGQNANAANAAHANNVEGKNCIVTGCHLDVKPWGFGGTVYTTTNGGATVKNAEVRVTGPNGALVGMAYTDDNGNFWYEGARPPANSRVGVRNATLKKVMTGTIAGDTGAACSSANCHGAAAMKVFLN